MTLLESLEAGRLRLLGPRVLLKRIDLPEQTESGLYIIGREWPALAEVKAIGTGWTTKKGPKRPISDLKVGDLVQYSYRRHNFAWEKWALPGAEDWAVLFFDDLDLVIADLEPANTL